MDAAPVPGFRIVPHRLLMLDFDGVLNSTIYLRKLWQADVDSGASRSPIEDIDREAVAILDTVCKATDCAIVISSSWRHGQSHEVLGQMLRKRGLEHGEVIGATPTRESNDDCRGDEIASFLREHAREQVIHSYAIVDDDIDAGMGHPGRFVQTNREVGLTMGDAEKLIAILLDPAQRLEGLTFA